nr:PadR family transcriptional regulator [uncultured Cohaesibacter sp.]
MYEHEEFSARQGEGRGNRRTAGRLFGRGRGRRNGFGADFEQNEQECQFETEETLEARGRGFGGKRKQERKHVHMAEWLASGGGPFHPPFKGGRFGRGNGGGGEGRRRGRLLAQGDIRTLCLWLIEQTPRHGYDVIKEIEALTNGFYAPSPGVVYPTLTYLEEANYTEVQSENNKKQYAITAEGTQYLNENREQAERIIDYLKGLGERAKKAEKEAASLETDLPRSVEAAFLNLKEIAAEKIKNDPSASTQIVQKLLSLADEL